MNLWYIDAYGTGEVMSPGKPGVVAWPVSPPCDHAAPSRLRRNGIGPADVQYILSMSMGSTMKFTVLKSGEVARKILDPPRKRRQNLSESQGPTRSSERMAI